jgi:hypothetical protein
MAKDFAPLMTRTWLYVFTTSSILVITINLCSFDENANAQITASITNQGSKTPSISTENYCFAPPNFLSSTASLSLPLTGLNRDQSSKPWLGLELINITPKIGNILHTSAEPRKFLVSYVFPGSPAAKTGIQGGKNVTMIDWDGIRLGGDIILGVDNKTFTDVGNMTSYIHNEKSVGDNLTLKIFRDGQTKVVYTTLTTRPSSLTYENPTYGIKIEYPSNWTRLERGLDSDMDRVVSPDVVAFYSPHPKLPEELVISVKEVNSTLQQYTDETIKKMMTHLANFKVITSTATVLAGNAAHKVVIFYKESRQFDTYLTDVWTIKDSTVYDIRYLSDPSRFTDCWPIAQKMIDSFEILK